MNKVTKQQRTGPVIFSQYERGQGIRKAFEIGRENILYELRESKLKGRGGAGFPTSMKWMLAAAAKGSEKFLVCNADEGEPGTFKDRVLLTEYPELLFDGMIIGGFTIGAKQGIVYLRGEYEYMKDNLEEYLEDLKKGNLLGSKIIGNENFSFDIEIRLGSGAYVCGEETALIESLEGHRGESRNRPPYPVNTGFNGRPTSVNNVETLCAVPHIVLKGGSWYSKFGTNKSTGTKLFSVSGDCKNPGVYELRWGTTINELLVLVGAKETKAVQVGGASGVCIPENQFNRKLAYEDASTGGSIMIFNKDRNMLQVLENFMEFFTEESCGQCTPCRAGNVKLLEGVKMLKSGNYKKEYIDSLKSLAKTMQLSSKCGLGQSSPNPFLTILENFSLIT